MAYVFLLGVILLGLLARMSQANLLGDAHPLKRYSQVYDVPPVATHLASDVLSGNSNATRTSIRVLLPTSTLRMVDATSLSSPLLFESTGLETETNTIAYIDHGTSEALSQTTEIISDPVSDGQGTSATSIEVDWTRLLPVTPSIWKSFFKTTHPDTSYDTGSGRATEPATTDISLQPTPIANSDTSVAFLEPSETSRSGAESKGLGTVVETGMFPSETSQSFQDSTTRPFTTLPDQTNGSTSPSSEAVTVSNGGSRTLGNSQPAMESGTTGLESPTTLTDSPYTSSPRLPLRKQSVTKSDPKSLASEKTSEITNLPITTGSMASSTMTSEDVIVTGTDGTVATYVPEQNKDYISSTGTTTTTDDNGAAIVIFPFGWFWKLHDGKGGGGVAKPPAPTANPVPGNEPSDKNEDNDDNDDDDASTKEDNRSTITTVLPTTQEPTSGTTTTSEETTSEESSTDEEATRTYYPCVIHGGPAIETPYCQCSTTVSGEGYYATTTLIDDQCIAYTEFPSQITSAPDTGPITDEPIQQPITATADGTVLVWSAYVLDYINVTGITKITQSVGVGEPSTLSTPLPSQTAVDNDGGGQCGTGDGLSKKGLREACDRAINKFDDDTIYSDYVSRYSRSTKGILVAASVGQAACIAKFQCDDYGIGMKGSDIKEA
ncbi:hypothetical protein Forpe1208_v011235 [Fusarium oxysporum f. sp. rapae]|uniref:Uncharacterized protein n=1 Tax=Fusarium oxysporum f. sp. rapae TaxID=485398 RepID=A0A8J5NP67_FUSOX|nr:hypothetical protein Forpe1208_v011235 [Fusarium oxysporum f. sp. rapae]